MMIPESRLTISRHPGLQSHVIPISSRVVWPDSDKSCEGFVLDILVRIWPKQNKFVKLHSLTFAYFGKSRTKRKRRLLVICWLVNLSLYYLDVWKSSYENMGKSMGCSCIVQRYFSLDNQSCRSCMCNCW